MSAPLKTGERQVILDQSVMKFTRLLKLQMEYHVKFVSNRTLALQIFKFIVIII